MKLRATAECLVDFVLIGAHCREKSAGEFVTDSQLYR